VALHTFVRYENLAELRELVQGEVAEDVEARSHVDAREPLSRAGDPRARGGRLLTFAAIGHPVFDLCTR
jgi:K+-sensing histidine kinase KdpD